MAGIESPFACLWPLKTYLSLGTRQLMMSFTRDVSVIMSTRTRVRIRNVSEGQAQSAFGTRAALRTFSVTEVIDLKIS